MNVTRDYLVSKKFIKVDNEYMASKLGVWDLEYANRNDVNVYTEQEICRQQFAVVFFGDDDESPTVFVQYNIGCGWMAIPDGFAQLQQERFEALFFAIRGEKL